MAHLTVLLQTQVFGIIKQPYRIALQRVIQFNAIIRKRLLNAVLNRYEKYVDSIVKSKLYFHMWFEPKQSDGERCGWKYALYVY